MERVIFQQILLFPSDIRDVRKKSREQLLSLGISKKVVDEIELMVAELASNLIKHKVYRGELGLKLVKKDADTFVEITSTDRGPGIDNLEEKKKIGRSTSNTLGLGFAMLEELSDLMDVSTSGHGTKITLLKKIESVPYNFFNIGYWSRPYPGEEVSGDEVLVLNSDKKLFIAVIDALGHGMAAHETARKAKTFLMNFGELDLEKMMKMLHQHLYHSRGAAVCMVLLNATSEDIKHLSIGNVESCIQSVQGVTKPFCYNGTVGVALPNFKVNSYHFYPQDILYLFTDGIKSTVTRDINIKMADIQTAGKYLFEKYQRNNDDATLMLIQRIA